ncbi:MAG: hypothetical protein KGJ86_00110 [Chloroflexota bacterium]|nr:hypothetical protein [Chloroflexota bacterium]
MNHRRDGLTETDKQVLQLLAIGLSLSEIGDLTFRHWRGVQYHVKMLCKHLGVEPVPGGHHLRAVVWKGIEAGLVELPQRVPA